MSKVAIPDFVLELCKDSMFHTASQDVEIWAGDSDEPFLCHSRMLQKTSRVVSAMLEWPDAETVDRDQRFGKEKVENGQSPGMKTGQRCEKKRMVLRVEDSSAAVRLLLHFLYTGQVPDGEDPTCDVLLNTLRLASRWQMTDVVAWIAAGFTLSALMDDKSFQEIAATAFQMDGVPQLRALVRQFALSSKKVREEFDAVHYNAQFRCHDSV